MPTITKYKDRGQLKEQVYNLCLENIERAKDFFRVLVPKGEDEKDYVTVNGEQANECMRVINEALGTLVKLYAEINKEEQGQVDTSKTMNSHEIYKVLDQMGANPLITQRQDVITQAAEEKAKKRILDEFKFNNNEEDSSF